MTAGSDCEELTDPDAELLTDVWRPRLGVVTGQRSRQRPVTITSRHGAQQVLVAIASRHHPHRHRQDEPPLSPKGAHVLDAREGGDLYDHPLGCVAANLLDLFALWRFCRSPKSRERHPVARMECATWLRRDALLASQGSSREVIHGPTAPPRAFYDSHMPQASSSRESVGMPTTSFWARRSLRRTVRVPTRQPKQASICKRRGSLTRQRFGLV